MFLNHRYRSVQCQSTEEPANLFLLLRSIDQPQITSPKLWFKNDGHQRYQPYIIESPHLIAKFNPPWTLLNIILRPISTPLQFNL